VQTAGFEVAVGFGIEVIGAFKAVHLDGDCKRILPHLRNAFAQSVCQTTRGKKLHDPSPDHPDQGHLAQPLLEACASVLCRQGNSFDYGFTEYLPETGKYLVNPLVGAVVQRLLDT
jgi:hypothetical protein